MCQSLFLLVAKSVFDKDLICRLKTYDSRPAAGTVLGHELGMGSI